MLNSAEMRILAFIIIVHSLIQNIQSMAGGCWANIFYLFSFAAATANTSDKYLVLTQGYDQCSWDATQTFLLRFIIFNQNKVENSTGTRRISRITNSDWNSNLNFFLSVNFTMKSRENIKEIVKVWQSNIASLKILFEIRIISSVLVDHINFLYFIQSSWSKIKSANTFSNKNNMISVHNKHQSHNLPWSFPSIFWKSS